ncbi:MAG TPA: oxidoreductase [Rugosimonospora sp.]|nr:oxidoreductase [Rugosimonospora sp.]
MTPDGPLGPLLALADVPEALDAARESVDTALRHPSLRRSGGRVAAEAGLRSAVASAALQGHGYALEDVRAGTVTDPVAQGALRVSRELDLMAPLWTKVPRQVLARIHVLAARDVVSPDQLGRPTADDGAAARLSTLLDLVTGSVAVPSLLLAAVVHGELLALSPFAGVPGVVARAAARLTLVTGGLDPRGLLPVDVGHLEREPEYLGAQGAFATGTPDGLRSWLKHCAAAVARAADEVVAIGDAVSASA